MKVLFVFKKNRTQESEKLPYFKGHIYFHIRIDGLRTKSAKSCDVKPCLKKDWDSQKNLIKTSENCTRRLRQIENELNDLFFVMRLENKFLTAEELKKEYLARNEKPKPPRSTLASPHDEQKWACEYLEKIQRKVELKEIEKLTLKNKKSRIKLFLLFLSESQTELKNFDLQKAEEFIEFCKNKSESNNYLKTVIIEIKAFVKFCFKSKYIPFVDLDDFDIKTQKVALVYYQHKEVEALEKFESEDQDLIRARDLFLFQIYTGFRYSDTLLVSESHFIEHKGKMFLVKEPKKTSKKHQNSIVPISLKLKELLAKYGGLPPKISYQTYWKNLKILGKLFNISNLLSHSGRRTFGNEYLNSGFSETATATAMGHADFKTTAKHYAVVQIERIFKELEGKEGF